MEQRFIDLSTDRQAIRSVLQNMGLLQAEQPLQVSALTGGVSSNILKIATAAGEFCLKQALPTLKVAKEWHAPLERVFAEIDWMKTIAAIRPEAVPRIVGVDKSRLCFVMDYLPADSFPNWKNQLLAGEIDSHFAARLGELLSSIHSHTAHNQELARQFAYDDHFFSLRLDPYLGEIARQYPQYAGRIHAVLERTRNTRIALVHGDISPKNILRGPSGPTILDAECAWYGDPAFDAAFCLNHFLLKAAHAEDPETQQRLMQCFRQLGEAWLGGAKWEPSAALEARVATLLPCLLLARVDGKSPVEYLSEQAASRVRRAACQLLEQQPLQLSHIQAFWTQEICA
ncbi:phosphotransferase family enzyme [Enterobacter sp. BIGb0383]|uniref:phosphotransferase family protein n=1 Tax=unclassified Enterobacter TaxID=2608935 RepID=UPI000F48B89D|nr:MULTISPECIES: aminoglycoside phosphotransferase family protein [unclassified Enterobacter]ROP50060.1 phosphotransferase family enzyme [Enterobacter sp. BIGb0383]ROS06197.1 phosphotransferase family enzyme [Enterobacter sp. BIGb0359]